MIVEDQAAIATLRQGGLLEQVRHGGQGFLGLLKPQKNLGLVAAAADRPPANRLVSPDPRQEGNDCESNRAISTIEPESDFSCSSSLPSHNRERLLDCDDLNPLEFLQFEHMFVSRHDEIRIAFLRCA